ncbi:uncharacterized protein LOC115967031 [Quercus lobata]|uniref:uncharacterized protein LOC115967031 n=1 Tax=Quercus lobata TaxID=97700 RepID=UPI0012483140|nr:uncharacterized protein LOC115967031 [Quercus lobata]
MARALGAGNILLKSDSQLVIGQLKGDFEIPRDQNAEADEVARSTTADDKGKDGQLPLNPEEAKKIQKQVAHFTILNDEFYKRGFSQPYLRCVEEEKAKYVLEEVHGGVCGDHLGAKFLIRKIMRTGYFWPSMQQDALEFVKWCNYCQRFGIPRMIISNNGRQFDSQGFKSFCSSLGIKNKYSSPGQPQANGQTEVTNETLLKIIKAQLVRAKGAWPKELPGVLGAYRTTIWTPTGETPFNLTYGT